MLFSPQILMRAIQSRTVFVGYTGPGDVVASATAWWGLRGYSAAYSSGSNPAIDVVDTATGLLGPTTINITSGGNLDVATILGLGYAVSVKKIYDQTGNGFHLTQATLANMPVLTQNAVGSLPGMTFSGDKILSNATGPIQAQSFTISAVAKRIGSFTTRMNITFSNTGNSVSLGFDNVTNQLLIFAGSVLTATASDSVVHSLQALINGASSNIVVDNGTPVTGAGGSQSLANDMNFGDISGGTANYVAFEMGYWPGNVANLSSNQHAYWGF